MFIYATWELFSREHSGRMEKEREQACLLMLALLFFSYMGMLIGA